MKHTVRFRAACLAALLCVSASGWTWASSGVGDTAATPAAATVAELHTETEQSQITEADGRWLVSDTALAPYGIKAANEKKGTYYFRLPENETVPSHAPIALQLPGQAVGKGRMINIKHLIRPLGLSYEVNGETKILLPPQHTNTGTVQLQVSADVDAETEKKAGKIDTVLFWDPTMNAKQSLVDLKRKQAVMSPCAFRLTTDGVELRNAELDRLADVYDQSGYAMWPLVDNNFDPELTHQVLASPALQEKIARQLAGYAILYDFKGYNLDFENVRYADKDKLTAFVKKISDTVHAYGIQLSMDVTPISDSPNWSLVYDRKNLAPALDYVMVMAYDQVGRTSPVAGPVASYPWVEKAVQRMTEVVPPEKIILGMPLYMRVWYESYDQKELPEKLSDWPAADKQAWTAEHAKKDASADDGTDTASANVVYSQWQSAYVPIDARIRPVPLDEGLDALPATAPARLVSAAVSPAVKKKPKLFVRTLTLADSEAVRKAYSKYIVWDDTLHLWYLDVPVQAGRIKIWFEDEATLKEKAALIRTYRLGGAAFWRKGFEPDGFWKGFAKHELT